MDNLSKKMVLDTADDTNNIIPLPAQMIYLCIKNPVVHDLSNTLIANEMKNEIKTCYEKHHDIPQTSFQHVDWEANKLAMSTASELSYRKTFHDLRNTMTINKKWKRIDSDLCPMCSKRPETIQHLLSCTHPDMTTARTTAMRGMFQTINGLNTQQNIVSFWKSVFKSIEDETPVLKSILTMEPTTWSIVQAYHQQQAIGWTSFAKGLLTNKWSKIQQNHYDVKPRDGENIFR